MKRSLLSLWWVISIALFIVALQADVSAQNSAEQSSEFHGSFPTTLTKSIDSKKLKPGDTVVCQTMATLSSRSGMTIPAGSKVIGHVTEAKARSKGDSEASLGFTFDKIEVKDGKDLPIKGVLQAVGPSLGNNEVTTNGQVGGLNMGGHGGTADDTATVPPPTNGIAGPNSGIHPMEVRGPMPMLNPQSQGVLGIKNLAMDKDSVLHSTAKEVKLENGTQMMIKVAVETPTQ